MSNFLGDFGGAYTRKTSILSAAELVAREGVNLQKGMNYRDGEQPSVFLVLPREGEYSDEWQPESSVYVFQGHDSVTGDAGKEQDQRAMYESGRLSDNGRFIKATSAFASGERAEPPQVQVYEKLDPGVWFDKGIFNLVAAHEASDAGRRVYRFMLRPANVGALASDSWTPERFLPAAKKVATWETAQGRCTLCGEENNLRFICTENDDVQLLCPPHRGEGGGLLD